MADASAPAKASARFVRVTPMKARRVVDLIRGQQADEALAVLRFAPQAASEPVYKVLASAVANAQYRAEQESRRLDVEDLVVQTGVRGRGADAEAVPPPGAGPRVPRAQAFQPHHDVVAPRTELDEPTTKKPAKKSSAKKSTAKRSPAKRPTTTKKSTAKKSTATKSPAKKAKGSDEEGRRRPSRAEKTTTKKTATKKAATKKAATESTASKRRAR